MPNLLTLRPADGNEVSGAYRLALENTSRPSVLALSRQNLPQLAGTSIDAVRFGAYALNSVPEPDLIIVGTGSEVSVCVEAAAKLGDLAVRVVSMPCWELFDEQPAAYRLTLFPAGVPVLSVEAGATLGWQKYAHASVGIDSFGASGPEEEVYAKFGLTPDNIALKAQELRQFYGKGPAPSLVNRPF